MLKNVSTHHSVLPSSVLPSKLTFCINPASALRIESTRSSSLDAASSYDRHSSRSSDDCSSKACPILWEAIQYNCHEFHTETKALYRETQVKSRLSHLSRQDLQQYPPEQPSFALPTISSAAASIASILLIDAYISDPCHSFRFKSTVLAIPWGEEGTLTKDASRPW